MSPIWNNSLFLSLHTWTTPESNVEQLFFFMAPHVDNQQGGRWECHFKYLGQKSFSYFLSMQQTKKGEVTIVA